MNDKILQILRCPVCKAPVAVSAENKSLFCNGIRRHSYDFSRKGYLNLSLSSKSGGDDREMVKSRTAFLSAGYYQSFCDGVLNVLKRILPDGGTVIDAGCGEGYYTNQIAREGYSVLGFDLSKSAVDHAAGQASVQGIKDRTQYVVSGIHELPVASGTADAVISIFAPCAEAEFLRVLRPGGILILAGAGQNHLMGLKRVLYDETYSNRPRADLPQTARQISREQINQTITITDPDLILSLFSMTPYFWRTKESDREKLNGKTMLTTEISMDLMTYRKDD